MSTAITVREISKRYRIGLAEERSETFAGQIMDMVKAPLRNLKQLRSLSRFKEEDESVFWALRDISFEVQEGEVLGIIGHNGAGKSTLLKILSRITEPTTGEITIKGRVSSLLEVGTGFHPDLTGRENIYMNGTILGMRKKEIDRKLEEIIAFSGVTKYIDTPVKRYSSGMKVRLAFSVAAHLEPDVLIIDEVLAVGDAEFQSKCLGKMKEVAGKGRTVLFVSHQMNAISTLCTRLITLKHGNIVYNGGVMKGLEKYFGSQRISKEKGVDETLIKCLSFIQKKCIIDKNAIFTNDDLTIRIDFIKALDEFLNLKIALSLRDKFGNKVLVLGNEYKPYTFSKPKNKSIYCRINKLNLIPGSYTFDIWLADDYGILELSESFINISIVDANISDHTIGMTTEKHGYIILDYNWNEEA